MKNTMAVRNFELALRNCGRDKYIKKGNVFGPVICGDYIMQYCFAGRGVFEVDGKNFPAEKGDGSGKPAGNLSNRTEIARNDSHNFAGSRKSPYNHFYTIIKIT